LASEGHIPRTALAIFNGVVDAQANGSSHNVRIDVNTIDGYVRTTYPEIATRFNITGGTPPPPPSAPHPSGPRIVSDSVSDPARPGEGPRVVNDTTGGNGTNGGASGPRVVGAATGAPVALTADNVILPADAAPEVRPERAAVRAQVILTYSRYFMSQAAREALMDFRPLPAGNAAINSAFIPRIEAITDAIMERYDYLRVNNPTELARLWDLQRERGFLVRNGAPEGLVTERGSRLITEWATDARVAEFGADAPALYEREARNRLGNTESFRRGMVEMLRDPVRIGGR
jgi:hypothetical protein